MLDLQLKDVRLFAGMGKNLTVGNLQTVLQLMQYNGISQFNEFYVPKSRT